VIILLTTEGF